MQSSIWTGIAATAFVWGSVLNAQTSVAADSTAAAIPVSVTADRSPGISRGTVSATPAEPSKVERSAPASPAPAGPLIAAARAGLAPAPAPQPAKPAMLPAQRMGAGQPVALMVVGGVATVAGLVIGGDGGTLIAIGGLGVGLWGLYNYIK